MLRDLRRRRRALFLALLTATTLAACGGGGDDDEDEDDDDSSFDDDADAAGLWGGTVNRIGVANPFVVIASPNGDFIGVVISTTGTGRLLVGTGTVNGTALNATGTIFPGTSGAMPNGQPVANVTLPAATVNEYVSMSGSYSGGGEVGIFTLNYDLTKTRRGASFTAVGGTYTFTGPTPTQSASLTITGTGTATYSTGAGCNGTGTFTIPDAAYNVYSWTLNVGVCGTAPAITFGGLATLDDNPTGGTNNLLRMFGAKALTRDVPFGFVGNK
jgi:hypothetical protein